MNERVRGILTWIVVAFLAVSFLLVTAWAVWAAGREGFMCAVGALGMMLFMFSLFLSLVLKEL